MFEVVACFTFLFVSIYCGGNAMLTTPLVGRPASLAVSMTQLRGKGEPGYVLSESYFFAHDFGQKLRLLRRRGKRFRIEFLRSFHHARRYAHAAGVRSKHDAENHQRNSDACIRAVKRARRVGHPVHEKAHQYVLHDSVQEVDGVADDATPTPTHGGARGLVPSRKPAEELVEKQHEQNSQNKGVDSLGRRGNLHNPKYLSVGPLRAPKVQSRVAVPEPHLRHDLAGGEHTERPPKLAKKLTCGLVPILSTHPVPTLANPEGSARVISDMLGDTAYFSRIELVVERFAMTRQEVLLSISYLPSASKMRARTGLQLAASFTIALSVLRDDGDDLREDYNPSRLGGTAYTMARCMTVSPIVMDEAKISLLCLLDWRPLRNVVLDNTQPSKLFRILNNNLPKNA